MPTTKPVGINAYEQRSTARGVARPTVNPDTRSPAAAVAEGIGAVGAGLRDMAAADLAVHRLREARARDQATVEVAHRMAESRVEAQKQLREMAMNAEDGAAGLTQRFEGWFNEHEQSVRETFANSPWGQQLFEQNWAPFRVEALDVAAQAELEEGRRYRVDRAGESTRLAATAVLSDPAAFARVVEEQRSMIASLRDIYPDERRTLVQNLETETAVSAVVGAINADPYAARRMLGAAQGTANPQQVASIIGGAVTSTQRTAQRNADVGGVPNSMHLTGEAVDLTVPERYQGMDRAAIEADVRRRLGAAGVAATEVLFEGDHIHVGWRGARPHVTNADGTVSTEDTITIESDGRFVNIPTVVNGERVSDARAAEMWRAGDNPEMGSFGSMEEAETAAQERSNTLSGVRADNPLYYLSAARIETLRNQADAEIDRREARARSELGTRMATQETYLENGLPVDNPVSVDEVRSAFGEDRARAWGLQLAASEQWSGLASRPNAELADIVTTPRPGNDASADEILAFEARRTAATRILESRNDPASFLLNHGVSQGHGLTSAFTRALQEGTAEAWGAFDSVLQQRAGAAREGQSRYGLQPLPFTEAEATHFSRALNAMPSEARQAFFQRARSALLVRRPRHGQQESPVYNALVRQLMPESPTTAYAGWIYGLNRSEARGDALSSETDARLILRGEDLLRRGEGAGDRAAGGQRPVISVNMPAEPEMQERWQSLVGDAYEFAPEAGQAAYQAFRAHYAASIERSGNASGDIDRNTARRSALAASGGVVEWAGRSTVIPWGYTQDQFEDALNRAWPAVRHYHPELGESLPEDFELSMLGGGRYALMLGGSAIRDARTGEVIEVQLGAR